MMRFNGLTEFERLNLIYDYLDTVTANIEYYLEDKETVDIHISTFRRDFLDFWRIIKAEGDVDEALEILEQRHNSTI